MTSSMVIYSSNTEVFPNSSPHPTHFLTQHTSSPDIYPHSSTHLQIIEQRNRKSNLNAIMQLFKTILIATILAFTAHAGVPTCGQKCFTPDVIETSGCTVSDIECICNSDKVRTAAKKCVQSHCKLGDQISTIPHPFCPSFVSFKEAKEGSLLRIRSEWMTEEWRIDADA